MNEPKRPVRDLVDRLNDIPPDPKRAQLNTRTANPFVFSDAALQSQLDKGNVDFIDMLSDLVHDIETVRHQNGLKDTKNKEAILALVLAERTRRSREGSDTAARHLFNVIVDEVFAGTHLRNRLT